ncbi:MAG: LysR family transcriptional regulator [Negativicutes bacterium]|nr:LysR family transcriptional regulator [Negativicutes bacterium]
MELNHLQYVVELANHLNFSKAASSLFITQPTLSQQIAKLEEEIGIKLFERKTRSVKLTSAGEEFVIYAKRALSEIQNLRQAMQEYTSLDKGRIKFGFVTSLRLLGITSCIAAFQKRHPGIDIQIIERGSQDLVNLLQTTDIDIALLVHSPDKISGLPIDFYPLVHGRLVLVVAKQHPLVGTKVVSFDRIAHEKFILPAQSYNLHDIILAACRSRGFEPKTILQWGQLETMFDLVANGLGVGFVSSQVMDNYSRPDIAVLPIEPVIERTTYLAISSDKQHLPAVVAFKEFILNTLTYGPNDKWIK